MNVSGESEPTKDILYVNFNQSSTTLCVGAKTGYSLYNFETVYEIEPSFDSRELEDICIIERNFATSLVAYVELNKPRNLILYNLTKGTEIVEKLFPNTVLSVRLNRNNVVVCLEDRIYVMSVKAMSDESTHIITNTPINEKGLIALSYGTETSPSLLAYPGSSASGDVQIFDCCEKHAKIAIPAHTSQLASLAFDEDGEKLATASIKGTVIRVFSVTSGDMLFDFRRGLKRCAEIQCLSFCKNPELLCASSNTETIHIFKLCPTENEEPVEGDTEGWMEMFGRVLTRSAEYLPTQVYDVLMQQRCFAYVHLPFVDQKTICAIIYIKKVPYVVVASLQGFLYLYDINIEIGGPCHLVKQHRLEGPPFMNSMNKLNSKKSSFSIKTSSSSSTASDTDPTACVKPEITINHFEEKLSTVNGSNEDNVIPEILQAS